MNRVESLVGIAIIHTHKRQTDEKKKKLTRDLTLFIFRQEMSRDFMTTLQLF